MAYQAPEKVVTIKGEEYKGINIGGKAYAPVPRRVESAHKNGGYSMIRVSWPEIHGIKCCEVEIEYNGQRFIGTSELRMDFKNPISDGQTSALGRALGFAGFDIETAIASAEDMQAVMEAKGARVIDSEPPALPDPEQRIAARAAEHHRQELQFILKRSDEMGLNGKRRMEIFEQWTGKPWNDLNRAPTLEDIHALDIGLSEFTS